MPELSALRAELERERSPAPIDPNQPVLERQLVAILNERVNDIALELDLVSPTFAALVRIALAAGTCGALLVLFGDTASPLTARAPWTLAAVAGGLCGAGVSARFGQLAKMRADTIRKGCERAARSLANVAR